MSSGADDRTTISRRADARPVRARRATSSTGPKSARSYRLPGGCGRGGGPDRLVRADRGDAGDRAAAAARARGRPLLGGAGLHVAVAAGDGQELIVLVVRAAVRD